MMIQMEAQRGIREPERCCCGCCTVAQGTLVIAILDIIGSIWVICRDTVQIMVLTSGTNLDQATMEEFHKDKVYYLSLYCIGLFMALGYLAVSIMLYRGCKQRNPTLCRPWLIWNYISLTLVTIAGVVMLVVLATREWRVAFIMLPIVGGVLAIVWYFVNVVQRFVEELKGE